jgi:hypothetical protein
MASFFEQHLPIDDGVVDAGSKLPVAPRIGRKIMNDIRRQGADGVGVENRDIGVGAQLLQDGFKARHNDSGLFDAVVPGEGPGLVINRRDAGDDVAVAVACAADNAGALGQVDAQARRRVQGWRRSAMGMGRRSLRAARTTASGSTAEARPERLTATLRLQKGS